MDLFKAITGKNPEEFEYASHILIDTPDVRLFSKLVEQDDFLFSFVRENVAKRILKACNADNYKNILSFFEYYSASYDELFAEVINKYGDSEIFNQIKEIFYNGSDSARAYAVKCFIYWDKEIVAQFADDLRKTAESDYEPLSINSIEILSLIGDDVSKQKALLKLDSEDEFEQYDAVKFLVTYQAKEALPKIVEVMKNSSLSENIASEIPYLISLDELLKDNEEAGNLVLCNIISAIPDIVLPSAIIEYDLLSVLENLYYKHLTSSSALVLRIAKEKFKALTENEEYLYDCDKHTKDEALKISKFLSGINSNKLDSLLYDELYDESDFVFFAVEYADNIEELETLLDSRNQTLILKVLTILKEKQLLTPEHKELALKNITNENIKNIASVI